MAKDIFTKKLKAKNTKKSRDLVLSWHWSPQREKNASFIVVSRTWQPGLWLGWTSSIYENWTVHFFVVLSPFYVFEKRTSCCGQSQVCKCQVHGAQIVVYHFFHPDFPSNHGNDHVGNCFSASGLIICSLTKDSFVRKPCECCFSHSLGIFKGCP